MVFRKTVLDNGIRVITEKMPHVRSVTIGCWVGVGRAATRTMRPVSASNSAAFMLVVPRSRPINRVIVRGLNSGNREGI